MRLKDTFEQLKSRGEKALITFITAGDPDIETTEKLVLEMEKRGADIIELGLPFSDPLADGPVIQQSSQRALERGMNTSLFLEMVSRLRQKTQIPLVVLTYYNPVFSFGEERFVKEAARAGLDGII
ncbi:MAG: tryptophan synthase subunit alpha, partial [Candidatus Contubernalis sp.]|nr:tryptophan synthase subunit alpha [Candidatus Contubernalis sp.]